MTVNILIGRTVHVPVRLHWSVLGTGALVVVIAVVAVPTTADGYPVVAYWVAGVVMAVLFVASMLAHELAHVAAARHWDVRTRRVTLWFGGGITDLAATPRSAKAEFLISAAGPAATLGIGTLLLTIAGVGAEFGLAPIVVAALAWLAVIHGLVVLENLLPCVSADGGQMLYAALRHRCDAERAATIVVRVCRVLGGLVVGAGIVVGFAADVVGGLIVAAVGVFLISDSNRA